MSDDSTPGTFTNAPLSLDPVPDAPFPISNGPGNIPDADEVMGNDESIRAFLRTIVMPELDIRIGGTVDETPTQAHTAYQTLATVVPGRAGTYLAWGFFSIYDYNWLPGQDVFGQISTDNGTNVVMGFQRARPNPIQGLPQSDNCIVPLSGMAILTLGDTTTINVQGYKEGGVGATIGSRGVFYLRASD